MVNLLGIKIGDKHTWRDWGLRLESYTVPMPEAQTKTIEVPGMSSVLDLTEVLTGTVPYKRRTLSFAFSCKDFSYARWHAVYTEIANACHGQRRRIVLDTDPGYYYEGRCTVSSTKDNNVLSDITITVDAEPFKHELSSTAEPWPWNSFNFISSVIRDYGSITVDGSKTLTVVGYSRPEVPTFTCSAPTQLTLNDKTYSLPAGESVNSDIIIPPGETALTFTGSGTVSILLKGDYL